MEITSVNVRKYEKEGSRIKGFAEVVLDGEFKVRNIKIIEGDNGLFIAMPYRILPNGKRIDEAHPLNQETRDKFTKSILDEYEVTEYVPYNEDSEE